MHLTALLHPNLLLAILVYAPIFWISVYYLISVVAHHYKGWRNWFWGLPLIQYPSMFLVVVGCKRLRRAKYCQFMRYNDRLWLSPNVRGYNLKVDADGEVDYDA